MNIGKLNLLQLKEEDEKAEELSLGFKENSHLQSFFTHLKKTLKEFNIKLQYSGVYSNLYLWNILLMNFIMIFLLSLLLVQNYKNLPQKIGINLDNVERFDTLIDKRLIFLLYIFHLILIGGAVYFVYKSNKKLNHLLFLNVIYFGLFIFLEYSGLKNFFIYFT